MQVILKVTQKKEVSGEGIRLVIGILSREAPLHLNSHFPQSNAVLHLELQFHQRLHALQHSLINLLKIHKGIKSFLQAGIESGVKLK